MQYILYNLFHHAPMQARLTGGDQSVRQYRASNALDIIRNNIEASMYGCICLSSAVKSKGTSWTDTQLDPAVIACCSHQFDNRPFNGWLNAHPADHPLQYLQLLSG